MLPFLPATPPERLPLLRPDAGRLVGGVAAGLAAHLGLEVRHVRLALIGLSFVGGIGVAIYVFCWLLVPAGDPVRAAGDALPASRARLSRGPAATLRRLPVRDILIGVLLVAGAVLLIGLRTGWHVGVEGVLPVLVIVVGALLAWSQLDDVDRGRLLARSGGRTPGALLRIAGGALLVIVGVVLLLGPELSAGELGTSLVAAFVMLAGLALVAAPWWLRLTRQLGAEREARAREAERADIAAHLHDSVLQTLALIRRGADDSEKVARLARAQERELREWLYDDRPQEGTSVAAELKRLVGQIEDGHFRGGEDAPARTVDTVVVGDCVPSPATTALLQATREALVNAVTHGAPPVSLFLEVRDDRVEAFVRDRGEGFDLDAVPTDRFGVRESILGRVRRRGGTAEIVVREGAGTEVRLSVPRAEPDAPAATSGSATSGSAATGTATPSTAEA
ncbi:ATP-binding protein [Sanguibacter massiliensis]|uniref:ATP-binding protein n=1 Tax=Sanguibacter massiliensis TaxID=1973217 RepID=UPI001F5CB393|nr:ATP-binding protein [Sanguibacter massiliensis]